ncbi:MAG: MBL fold metallo-hydrolase [Candidatus Bathyarchaeia archaeon]
MDEPRRMIVKPLAEESLGSRSMCTFIETSDTRVLLDPGISLCPIRSGFPPHPEEYKALIEGRARILKYAAEAEVVTISHYHLDHYTPPFEEWCYHWSSPEIARHVYGGKILLVKDYRIGLSYNQRRRGWLFLKTGGRHASKIENADGRNFKFGKTNITFSSPVYHGAEGTELGSVLMLLIEDEEERVVFASDVQGPMYDEPLQVILRWRPDILIVSGPPLYLSGFKVNMEDITRGVRNLTELARKVPKILLGHHFLRSADWRYFAKSIFDASIESGHEVLTFSECLGLDERVLEAQRNVLYKKYPPIEEFLKWSKISYHKRRMIKPPNITYMFKKA